VIVDIRELIEEEDIDVESHKDYFNLTVYTKIVHSLKKSKDIYYIPNFKNNKIVISEILKLRNIMNFDIKFNILVFYDEFINDTELLEEVFNNINEFDSSQIIKDY